jgi:hypothetical protein
LRLWSNRLNTSCHHIFYAHDSLQPVRDSYRTDAARG